MRDSPRSPARQRIPALPGYQKWEPIGDAHRRDMGGGFVLLVERVGGGAFTATLDGPGGFRASGTELRSRCVALTWANGEVGNATGRSSSRRPRRRGPARLARALTDATDRPSRSPAPSNNLFNRRTPGL
jgi:hypothetical protein